MTSTVNLTGVNDAPVLAGGGNTISYTENGASIPISPALTVTDADSANLSGGTVSIQTGLVAGDLLGFVNQNGITGSYDSSSGILTLSGSSSVANYQSALRSVAFSSSSDNPTANCSTQPHDCFRRDRRSFGGKRAGHNDYQHHMAVNDNPVAVDDTILRSLKGDAKVEIATLLANDTDAENDPLTITGVSPLSAGGASVTMSGAWIYYRHVNQANDTFTYTVSDGQGTATGTVHVNIQDLNTEAGPVLTPTVDGSGAHVTFEAVAGKIFVMQRSSNPAGPWTDRETPRSPLPATTLTPMALVRRRIFTAPSIAKAKHFQNTL